MNLISLAENGWLPDRLIRQGIRRLLRKRLRTHADTFSLSDFTEELANDELAVATAEANEQHYEVPAAFFQKVLGQRLKYSSCLYQDAQHSLDRAECDMLSLTCDRAQLADDLDILELGCGWGSLSLWMAEHYPGARITAVSNSSSQRTFIEDKARAGGLTNLRVITADMREFAPTEKYDRIVSVEMFEHMRNYKLLFERLSSWLREDGSVFSHIFCHRNQPYLFQSEGRDNWMGRHFFTGGTMPSFDLFEQFDVDLRVAERWQVSGMHYWQTCEHWLQNLDSHRQELLELFQESLSKQQARLVLQRWRMFFMACAELFRFDGGDEWFVGHYLMQHASQPSLISVG